MTADVRYNLPSHQNLDTEQKYTERLVTLRFPGQACLTVQHLSVTRKVCLELIAHSHHLGYSQKDNWELSMIITNRKVKPVRSHRPPVYPAIVVALPATNPLYISKAEYPPILVPEW